MEGKIGSVFESNFAHAVRNNRYNVSPIPSVTVDEYSNEKKFELVTKETKEKHVNHMLRNSGIATGVGVVLLTPVVILASKGKLPKPVMNFVEKKLNKIAKQINELKEKPQMSQAEMVYFDSLQKTSKTLNTAKNILLMSGPMKDVLLEKTLRTLRLGKVCDKISGFFEKMAVKMMSISYKKSSDAFTLMKEEFTQANKYMSTNKNKSKLIEINGVSKTLEEWVKIAEEKTADIDSSYDFFRPDSVKKRQNWLAKRMTGLGNTVFGIIYGNLKDTLKNPKKLTSFITEDLVAPVKTKLSRKVVANKKSITNSSEDVMKELKKVVSDIEPDINMMNKESLKLFQRMKKLINGYSQDSAPATLELKQEINAIISKLSEHITNSGNGYSDVVSRKVKKSLGYLKYTIETDKKGKVEELLDIYKTILPKDKYEIVSKAAKKSGNALNDAVYTETEKFVDKMRDLKSGAALTDVATGLLVPLGSTALGMSMADTKEKKRSVGLKLGIPLLVGLGTSMWGTIAMLTAGPSMLLGVITSTITNRVCSKIDDNLKKKDTEKNNIVNS